MAEQVLRKLPTALVLVGPLVFTLLVGIVVVLLFWPRRPPKPATAARHPVRLVQTTPDGAIFLCTHEGWAMDLARAYNGLVRPAPVREPFWEGLVALIPGVGLSALMSILMWNSAYPVIRIDNAGSTPIAVWVDGARVVVAAPNEEGGVTTIRVPRARHVLGYSLVSAPAPEHTVTVDLAPPGGPRHDSYLYNPGNTACYYLELTTYSSRSGNLHPSTRELPVGTVGPQSIQEFYNFEKVDAWFKEPPAEIRTQNNQRLYRTSLHWNEPCVALARRGCSLEVRQRLIACQDRAKQVDDVLQCVDEAERACAK